MAHSFDERLAGLLITLENMDELELIHLSDIPGYQQHVLMVLHFVRLYLLISENDLIVDGAFNGLPALTVGAVEKTTRKIAVDDGDRPTMVSASDIKTVYAALFYMNFLLVNEAGELMMAQVAGQLTKAGIVHSFEDLRTRCLTINGSLMDDMESRYSPQIPDFNHWKNALLSDI